MPDEKLIGYFYNPNIHPQEEYILRFEDTKRSCDALGIELAQEDYDDNEWIRDSFGMEHIKEGGVRCDFCFNTRLRKTALKAVSLNQKRFTTTLLMSPKKDIEKLRRLGEDIALEHGAEFYCVDFRKNGGTQMQFALAKEDNLYKQNYCGCLYALKAQRVSKNEEPIETYLPVSRQILPNSFEEKRLLYEKVSTNRELSVIKTSFLNYRLKRGLLKINGESVDSYIFFYSYSKNKTLKSTLQKESEGVFRFKNQAAIVVELKIVNKITGKNIADLAELKKGCLSVEDELKIRESITNTPYSLIPIIMSENIFKDGKYELYLDGEIFPDVRESLTNIR